MSSGFERRGKSNNSQLSREPKALPPNVATTLTHAEAKASGYTGNVCDICGSVRMRVAGHCMVCEECGSTTGCS